VDKPAYWRHGEWSVEILNVKKKYKTKRGGHIAKRKFSATGRLDFALRYFQRGEEYCKTMATRKKS